MKKISIIIAGCAVLAFAASCSDEQRLGDGQGKLVLTTTVNSDMEVVSRALADDLAASTRVWISNSRGLIRKYDSASELPTEAIDLVSGSYVAEGWAGDSVPASWAIKKTRSTSSCRNNHILKLGYLMKHISF